MGYVILIQEAHEPWLAFLSENSTADMQMLYMNIFPILSLQLMKGSSFEQFLVLTKKGVYFYYFFFCRIGHDSQWSMTISTNSLSRFNSRIDTKFGGFLKFNNIMILYMCTAQEEGKITLIEQNVD